MLDCEANNMPSLLKVGVRMACVFSIFMSVTWHQYKYEGLNSWVGPRSWADFISEFPDRGLIHVLVMSLVLFYFKCIFLYMAIIKTAFTFQPASGCLESQGEPLGVQIRYY